MQLLFRMRFCVVLVCVNIDSASTHVPVLYIQLKVFFGVLVYVCVCACHILHVDTNLDCIPLLVMIKIDEVKEERRGCASKK